MQIRKGLVPLRWLVLLTLGLWLGGAPLSSAQDANVSKLRDAGMAAYESGNYAAAKQAFDQAFGLSPLHSLGLWTARARAKLGELLEADERYEKVLKAPLTESAPSAEREAQEHAAREREELRHRIPRLRIKLEGVDPSEVEVRLDGALVADEYVIVQKQSPFPHGKALQVNPGSHQIVAVSADQRKDLSVTLAEGQTREVNLRFANSGTLKQRKCRDQCRTDCGENNECYVACKQRCFSKAS